MVLSHMAYWICASADLIHITCRMGQVTNRRSEKKTLHLNTLTVPRKNLVMISSPPVFIHNKAGLENLDRQGYKMHCGHSPERNLIAFPFFFAVLISLVHHPPRSSASTSYLSGGLSGGLHVQECWTSHRERRTP